MKRHRSSGEFEHASLYQHMPIGEPPTPHYNNTISSGSRTWTANDQQRLSASYGQQSHSPMGLSMMNRVQQPMHTHGGWQAMHQQSALPSPSASVSNQQPSYPTTSAPPQQQASSVFGDPGATASASTIPRQYYNSFMAQGQANYQGQPSGDVNSQYPDLSSIQDTSLTSGQMSGYPSGYSQAGGIYSAEPGDLQGGYAYGMADQKF